MCNSFVEMVVDDLLHGNSFRSRFLLCGIQPSSPRNDTRWLLVHKSNTHHVLIMGHTWVPRVCRMSFAKPNLQILFIIDLFSC